MLKDVIERDGRRAPVHFVGIGGIGVSGIARIFHRDGHRVTGSDLAHSPVIEGLERLGIAVALGHRPSNVPPDAALVVCSAAVKPGHPEIEEARRRRVPVLKYAQVLGRIMAERRGIAVAGTHGKTTTTAMIAHILVENGLDPTMVLGGDIPLLGGTSRVGRSDLMVAEACEYDRSFLNLHPTFAVVTNIEEDHLDYYRDLAEIRDAFRCFAGLVPPRGRIFVCAEDAGAVAAVSGLDAAVETYGMGCAGAAGYGPEWRADDVDLSNGRPLYTLVHRDMDMGRVTLLVPGRHNVLNSLAAIATSHAAGVPITRAIRSLASFPGVNRRFQHVAELSGATVIDDYAHHPTEIRSAIRAARERFPLGRVVAVFQPHQHSRTRQLLDAFACALAEADEVVLGDIYASRDSEADRRAVSSRDLVVELERRGKSARHIPGFDAIADHIRALARPGDAILFMGAGDIYEVAHALKAAPTPVAAA